MVSISVQPQHGALLPLDTLVRFLKETVSDGEHEWVASPVEHTVRMSEHDHRAYVVIGYNNPNGDVLHRNYLAYLFPLWTSNVIPGLGRRTLAFLDEGCAKPLSRGLHLEEGSLRYDEETDWERFWEPIRAKLLEAGFPVASLDLQA